MRYIKKMIWIVAVLLICVFVDSCIEKKSAAYLLGLLCGLIFSVLFFVFLKWVAGKLGGRIELKCREHAYDERQLLARGKAYQAAFFTLVAFLLMASLLEDAFELPLFMSFCGMWIGVCLSLAVFAVICIWKDAYMSLYENVRGVILLLSAVGIMNIGVGMRVILERRPLLENGKISLDYMNLVVGALFCVILVVFCARVLYNKKESEEDEESGS